MFFLSFHERQLKISMTVWSQGVQFFRASGACVLISPRDLKIVHFQIHLGIMLYYWLKALSTDWLVDLLTNWLNDWIFDWQLIYWLTTWLIDWLSNCLATCSILTDYNNWLTDGLTGWLTYWWPDWLTCTWQQTDSLTDKMSNLLLTDWLID